MLTMSKRKYGFRRQLGDKRDHLYDVPYPETTLSAFFDLRDTKLLPNVYDQGALGSCTANAIAGAFEYNEKKDSYGEEVFMPSRLFIYYNERKMEGSIGTDAGGQLRDGIKSINATGLCHESSWPYDITKFTEEPPASCYAEALQERALQYRRVKQTEYDMKHALSIEKQPIVFGFSVYESFEGEEVKKTGRMNIPAKGEKCLGGHAVLCVGYSDEEKSFIVRNSWGEEWGMGGYFYMPYEFILDPESASDFWIIKCISLLKVPPSEGQEHYEQHFPPLQPDKEISPVAESKTVDVEVPLRTLLFRELRPSRSRSVESTGCGPFKPGEEIELTWDTTGSIEQLHIQYAVNSWTRMMSPWTQIAEGVANTGSFLWKIPEDASDDTRYYLRIQSSQDPNLYTDSDYFAVQSA